jgi:error-prone DNA polymerase
MGAERYVPLWAKTSYSFLEGASQPDELFRAAAERGLSALAVTDRDGVYGLVRALVAAREHGVRLLPGAEVTLGYAEGREAMPASRVVILPQSRKGYGSLCRLLSIGRARCAKGSSVVTMQELRDAAGDTLVLCPDPQLLGPLADAYEGDLYALCARHLRADERTHERKLRAAAGVFGVPVVAANEVLYHHRARRPLQDVLTCIRYGVSLAEVGSRTRPNAEHDLKASDAFEALFADDPDAIRRTCEVAERCAFDLTQIRYRYPAEQLPDGFDEHAWLRELTLRGAKERYRGEVPSEVEAQIERELEVIGALDYGGYFLTMHELVQFCRAHDILCQGRGSAANSAVCYCLGITAVDPVRMDLLFERFLSRERAEPPDIDLDIEHERREEAIQHVYDKYGRRYAAMVANIIRYRPKSAVRDVGKALGIPSVELDSAAKLLGHYDFQVDTNVFAQAGLDPDARSTQLLAQLTAEIQDFPRHLSIHPGGFLLGHEPVDTIVPIEPATMDDRTVIQWDKDDLEELGLFKVDLLGLGALTVIHRAFDLMRAHEGLDLELATVPVEDPDTYRMCTAADTVGVFQIESRAQMNMLPRLQPKTFYDLVIEVAIVRPGPIQGDMVHPYLKRRSGEEPIVYPHPKLERILQKTLGVPIFQEQVMKLAVEAAGYTPGEADQLRRDMAAWRKHGRIEQHKERLVGQMIARGIPEEFAERVFSQIRGFGEYGFPESHAASFALLAYVTAWLKCHHPAAFACALLNAQPMGFYAPSTIVEDARRHGIEVLPVCINKSRWDCDLEDRDGVLALRMGLRYVKGLGERERHALDDAPGPYESLEAFVARTRLGKKPLAALAEAGAFDVLGLGRRDALWQARSLANHTKDSLFMSPAASRAQFAALESDEEVLWDYRRTAHSARGHPMARYRPALRTRRIPEAEALTQLANGRRTHYVGMVITRQRPQTRTGVTFYTLEDETGFVNLIVWRPVFDRHAPLAKTARLLGVTGTIQRQSDVIHLVAHSLWEPDLGDATPDRDTAPRSRDFH